MCTILRIQVLMIKEPNLFNLSVYVYYHNNIPCSYHMFDGGILTLSNIGSK